MANSRAYFQRALPPALSDLTDLAIDLRWTTSILTRGLWKRLDPETWERTENPFLILTNVSQERLEAAAQDPDFLAQLQWCREKREEYFQRRGWFAENLPNCPLQSIAYFSMEFGLSESLPIYSGGLGMLAGDHLKSASDLGVPLVGVGLLYQQGYFRQVLAADGSQLEAFPYNDPSSLPIEPLCTKDGKWLRIPLPLPGRVLLSRVWQARIGRVRLYLLDSNDPMNHPWDRGITANLYAAGREARLLQEMLLGLGGWRLLETLGLEPQVCHLNEGHAAFAVLARAMGVANRHGISLPAAFWTCRAGNVFTTHTPVAAAFDEFDPGLIAKYAQPFLDEVRWPLEYLMALGRKNPDDRRDPFNMAFLAMRGCGSINGVSQLHGEVSRKLFSVLFPRWPCDEIPIGSVTNGVHIPTWNSPASRELWIGHDVSSWLDDLTAASSNFPQRIRLDELWRYRTTARQALIEFVRRRVSSQFENRGESLETIQQARHTLDVNTLTIGFARRFTEYKRPNLLLHDPQRLIRILTNPQRPVQLIVAGKAHPNDPHGKSMVRAFAQFSALPELSGKIVFLEDYDMAVASHMVNGIDVWVNTPRRPAEACGTSGMKCLFNGGLHLSTLDGWWDEAYEPRVGWSVGDRRDHSPAEDILDATALYETLENQVVPEFYSRDSDGLPRNWLNRMLASMTTLTTKFSSHRMVQDYVRRAYLPATEAYLARLADSAASSRSLLAWHTRLDDFFPDIRFGETSVHLTNGQFRFEVQAYLGDLQTDDVAVQIYAEKRQNRPGRIATMNRLGEIVGSVNGWRYEASLPADRPVEHFVPRIVPHHPQARIPLEDQHILWHH